MIRSTPNGGTREEDGPFLVNGFLLSRSVFTHPHPNLVDAETIHIKTLDRKRDVGQWYRSATHTSGLVCHYRDRGDDTLYGAELDEVLAYARERWPRR